MKINYYNDEILFYVILCNFNYKYETEMFMGVRWLSGEGVGLVI